jgi:hypothetical protein
MYQRLSSDKGYRIGEDDIKLANALLASYLAGRSDFVLAQPKNAEWLKQNLGDRASVWMDANEVPFDTTGALDLKENFKERQRHFLKQAAPLFEQLRPSGVLASFESMTAETAIDFYRTLSSTGYSEEQLELYRDLTQQIRGLEQTYIDAYGGERPKSILIRKETEPMEALMLGSRVSGSCYDAGGVNYWVSFPDAIEANKGVFWITNENGKILGRVLLAIDKNNKIVRFPTYYAGVGIDLNPYIDKYVRDLAQKLGLGVNGESYAVERLLWSGWNSDAPRQVAEAI